MNLKREKRDGTTPIECLKDVKSAIRFLRKNAASYGIDPEKIAAGGGSAGGYIAAAAALLEGFNEEEEDTSTSCAPPHSSCSVPSSTTAKPDFITTMIEADKFLKSLGYLSGAPSQDLIEQIAAQGKEVKSKRAKTIKD